MKRILFLTFALCLLAISAFAQNRPDYSGVWELDTINSRLDDKMLVQSMTLKVTQTDREIKVGSFTKRTMQRESTGTTSIVNESSETKFVTYSLEGKQTGANFNDGAMSGTVTHKAAFEADGKLNLYAVHKYDSQGGEITVNIRETWELADEGKTLRIALSIESPSETKNLEMVFTKKAPVDNSGNGIGAKLTSGTISGGVLNGKATSLVKPAYPEAAKAVKAGGAVNVQVTIDETGKVISATAVSGHPLLRAASEEAALASTFSTTLLQGVPVKVTGIIVYNFTP
jgi:TonB family protein